MRAILVAMLAAFVFVAGARATPDAVLDEGLVFLRGNRVLLMQADGSGQRAAPFPAYPRYSPDGRRALSIAVGARGGARLIVQDARGGRRRVLATHPTCIGSAAWSPDSTRIAYTPDCEVDFQSIWVVERRGGSRRQLTGRWNLAPEWAPDGRTILFTSYTRRRAWRLFLMSADGRNRREIRGTYPATEARFAARWSRDGRQIYLLSESKDLLVMNRDGSGVRNLTPPGLDVGAYALSPDERLIAVHGVTRSGAARDIFLLTGDGTSVRQLTTARGADQYPQWSPDGRFIAFESNRDGNSEIYITNLDGTEQRNLTRNAASDTTASWVPRRGG